MSMKRSRISYSRPRRDDDAGPSFRSPAEPPEPEKSWAEYVQGRPDEAFVPYSLARRFEADALLAHPTFGRGAVLRVESRRIEVLFESGKKTLGHAG